MKLIPIAGPWPLCTNTFLLVTAAGHAVAIDPAADPAEYKSAAAEHGATITHVFLTHGHYDHVGAVRALRAAGAKVCGDAADALGTALHLESAEAHQLNLVALGQALGDDVDGGVDGGLGILLGQAGLLGGGIDKFCFIHVTCSSCVFWGLPPVLGTIT